MNELVSIVVPVYNMGDSIQTCVKSVQNQDYPDLEIILVDDGSKDNSYDVCCDIANNDPRVKVFHTENRGSGPARNYGIEKASGRYIYFPDADDYIEPNAISIMVDAMNDGEFDLVVFGFKRITINGKELETKQYGESSQDANSIRNAYADYMTTMSKWGIQGAPWNKFFDLNVIKKNEVEYPPLRRHQDEGFIGRYMCFANKVHFIPDVLYTYYVNDLQKEWKKYPPDYIDAVTGLFEVRKETILTWNEKDEVTHNYVQREYMSNFIKALELSFSPKMNFNKKQRKDWIINKITENDFQNAKIPVVLGKYQKVVMSLIGKKSYNLLYIILKIKITLQQTRLFEKIKKALQ